MKHFGRDQRDYIRFKESDSYNRFRNDDDMGTDGSFTHHPDERDYLNRKRELGRYPGTNRFGEERIRHDSFQDDFTFEDERGMKHPYEHGGPFNRWSDDIRSEASKENHSGKGPKGYSRSPQRIHDEACEILMMDFDLDASDIEVEVQGEALVLKGEVASRQEKRLAESLVENIRGIRDVHNQLKVKSTPVEGWVPGLGNIEEEIKGGENGQRK